MEDRILGSSQWKGRATWAGVLFAAHKQPYKWCYTSSPPRGAKVGWETDAADCPWHHPEGNRPPSPLSPSVLCLLTNILKLGSELS